MLVDLDDGSEDSLLGAIVKVLTESVLASAVALKRCSRRFKVLAAPLVASAVAETNQKWRDAAAKIGCRGGAAITYGLERNEVLTNLNLSHKNIRHEGAAATAEALRGNAVLTTLALPRNTAEARRGNEVRYDRRGATEQPGADHPRPEQQRPDHRSGRPER